MSAHNKKRNKILWKAARLELDTTIPGWPRLLWYFHWEQLRHFLLWLLWIHKEILLTDDHSDYGSTVSSSTGKSPGPVYPPPTFTFPGQPPPGTVLTHKAAVYYHHQLSLQEDQGIDMTQVKMWNCTKSYWQLMLYFVCSHRDEIVLVPPVAVPVRAQGTVPRPWTVVGLHIIHSATRDEAQLVPRTVPVAHWAPARSDQIREGSNGWYIKEYRLVVGA